MQFNFTSWLISYHKTIDKYSLVKSVSKGLYLRNSDIEVNAEEYQFYYIMSFFRWDYGTKSNSETHLYLIVRIENFYVEKCDIKILHQPHYNKDEYK